MTGLISCSYNFSEDYYVDITIPDAKSTIDLGELANDPVLSEPTTVSYQYESQENQELRQVAVYIDGNLANYFHDDSDDFLINTDNLTEGEHTLTIEYSFSSGSGSLADINNGESFTKTEEFNFTINKSGPKEVQLTKVEVTEGSIYVYWNTLSNANFTEAILRVQESGEYRIIEDIILTPENIASGSFNDRSNTELNLDYSIILKNRYSESTSNKINLSLPKPNLRGEIVSNTQYKIIWEEHPLYGNFDYYSYVARPDNTLVELNNRGGEYLLNDTPVFAQPTYQSLNLKRRNTSENFHHISAQIHFGKAFEEKFGTNYVFSTQTNSYYTVHLNGDNTTKEVVLSELSSENLSSVRSQVLFTTTDSSSNIILDPTDNTLILDLNKSSHKINLSDFNILESWNSEDYPIPTDYGIYTSYRNGSVIIRRISRDWVQIYDVTTSNLIYTSDIQYQFFMADDGRYFYNNKAIHEVQNGAVNTITPTYDSQFVHGALFIPELNVCVYSNVFRNPVIYNFANGTKKTLSNLTKVSEMNFDPVTQKILFYQHIHENGLGSYVNLYDPVTDLIKPLEVYDSHSSSRYIYLNEKLLYTGGFYLDNYLK